MFPVTRHRRLRQSPALRDLMQETHLSINDLVYPIFVEEEIDDFLPIKAMPGISRIPEKKLAAEIEKIAKAGIKAVIVFGVSHHKDAIGSDSFKENGFLARIIRTAKKAAPEMVIISDNCFCEYTDHGHCGVVKDGYVHNDHTLENLSKQAIICAQSGADMVAPSAMMDGQITAMRAALDGAGFSNTPIMAYAVKFASNFYGPFREAAGSSLKGDRKTYQVNIVNRREALREALSDAQEGADVLMVKPAVSYLDIISDARAATQLPIAAYQVSGEYAMIKFAAAAGALNEALIVRETLGSIKRAGADLILTYYAYTLAIEGI